ncbi:hypothetical protein SSYRP_v1c05330 [Spiroplasma syrphidicola EA-1]|uniref:Uncharacterized protein n=1 Tax=Spiroplasma syrphidicola EA-1 TaxID=1276229 RepID=R4U692_9MOLU|nr:hypothetical protein [Spiroplasma syrphidicola]AGM26123.1 hypothetical protein SSYRP_v1c05330 [Spiroplasma syrphidicola EA-1]
MKNKIEFLYNKMCFRCKSKFKQIVIQIKNNNNLDIKNLEFFSCKVEKNRLINQDHGVKPLAFIHCKNDSYAFFWKNSLYNGDGSSKIPVINNTIKLSQATIDKIAEDANNNLVIVNSLSNLPNVNSKIENNVSKIISQVDVIKRNNTHLTLQVVKTRKLIVILTLICILILGSVGSFLGWYFIHGENNNIISLPPALGQINLSDHLVDSNLQKINDNRTETILSMAKNKNSDLIVEDLLVKNITETTADIVVLSSNKTYIVGSLVNVSFTPQTVTLQTHVKKTNFFAEVDLANPEKTIDMIVNAPENKLLKKEQVQLKIENSTYTTDVYKATLIPSENNTIYLEDDNLEIFFSTTGKKLLSEVLSQVDLGDIVNKNPEIIMDAIKNKNPNIDTNQIEIVSNSIEDSRAEIKVSENSKEYILDSPLVTIYYRVFNPNIGTIKEKVEQPDGQSFKRWVSILFQLANGTILAIESSSYGSIYELNMDGAIKQKVGNTSNTSLNAIVQLSDGTILAGGSRDIYELNMDGTIKKKVEQPDGQSFDNSVNTLFQLANGTILAVESSVNSFIYELNMDGTIKQKVGNSSNTSLHTIVQLSDGTILAGGSRDIYELNMDGTIKKKVEQPGGVAFDGSVSSLIQLSDGTILAATGYSLYQLNMDGTIKKKIVDKQFGGNKLSIVQLNNGSILAASNQDIYQLNSE